MFCRKCYIDRLSNSMHTCIIHIGAYPSLHSDTYITLTLNICRLTTLFHLPLLHPGCPSERAMVLAQIQKKGFRDVLRSAGIRGLYHGAEATLYRDISFNMSLFVLRAYVMRACENHTGKEPGPLAKVWWGLPASVAAGIIACPFDVVKTRIQGKELQEFGMCFRGLQIYLQEGASFKPICGGAWFNWQPELQGYKFSARGPNVQAPLLKP